MGYKRTFKGKGLIVNSLKQNHGRNRHYGDVHLDSARFYARNIGTGSITRDTMLGKLREAAYWYGRDNLPQHARACQMVLDKLAEQGGAA